METSRDNLPRIGVIGFGAFGRFLCETLAPHAEIGAFDQRDIREEARDAGIDAIDLADAAARPIFILAVTVNHFEDVLAAASAHLTPGAIVVDVASVKVRPIELMQRHLSAQCDILGTHPLFGPQTAGALGGIAGQPIALCPVRITDMQRLDRIRAFLAETLGLRIVEIDPDAHDREMARVQALTHLIGHAAVEMDLPESPLATLAYTRLLELKRNMANHSADLFHTIQGDNPYAADARRAFRDAIDRLESRIDRGS